MSLINEVLRDLDTRNAADSERNGLDANVRALPQSAPQPWRKLLMPLLAASLGGIAVWLWLRPQDLPPPPASPSPELPALAAVPPPEPPPLPVEPAVPVAPAENTASLRLDSTITTPVPAKPASVLADVEPAQRPAIKSPAVPSLAKPSAQPAPTSTPAAASKPSPAANTPHISKQATDGNGSQSEQAEADYRRGYAALRRGAQGEANEAFRAALKVQSSHVNARQALLALLTEQKQWQDVEVLALDGVGLYPQRSDWAMLAARIMFERGDAANALDTLQQHASNARQNPDYQIFHALLLQRANRYAEAATCYQQALAQRPTEGRWWYGLGRALDADHREAEARQAYEKARDSGNLPPDMSQIVERRLR